MDDKARQFLDFYISSGQNSSKKVECYKMAFREEGKKLKDGSIETYAKRILASKEAKQYLSERVVTSGSSSLQLMESLSILDNMLEEEGLNTKSKVEVLRERRQTISELAKLIHVVKQENSPESQYALSDILLNMTVPYRLGDGGFSGEQALDLLHLAKSQNSFVSIDDVGTIILTRPLKSKSTRDMGLLSKGIKSGQYQIAVSRTIFLSND